MADRPPMRSVMMNANDAKRGLDWLVEQHAQLKEWATDGEISKRSYRQEKRVVKMLIRSIKRAKKVRNQK